MALATAGSLPTTASRFALLKVESGSDSESESGKGRGSRGVEKSRTGGAAGGKSGKKEKKRKKKEHQQSEANELRNLAFKKIPQKSSAGSGAQNDQPLHSQTRQDCPTDDWQEWKQKDEQLTSELFEADLEKALMISKLEFEEHKKEHPNVENASPKSKGTSKKDKRRNQQGKDRPLTVSLKDFQSDVPIDQLNRKQEEQNPSQPMAQDEGFFTRLEDDVSKILLREKRKQLMQCSGTETLTPQEQSQDVFVNDGRMEQLKQELERKDLEIEQLKHVITRLEDRYKEVKSRNAQLLKMLQEGEMKDKAEILLQVDELLNIKNELTLQVTGLHAALEQERSKVKVLQALLSKQQGGKKGKKTSETEQ